MALRITITDDAGEVVDSIDTFLTEIRDLRPFWAEIESVWWDTRRRMFETQGSNLDTPWVLYSETAEQSRYVWVKGDMLGLSGPVGDDDVLLWGGDGRLRRAVIGQSSEGSAKTSAELLTITIDVPYASHHDRGDTIAPEWAWPRGRPYTTPQRRIVALSGEFRTEFSLGLSRYMGKSGARLGLTTADLLTEINRTYQPEA